MLIILASDGMSLGVKPTGEPLARLERALDCLEKAEALGSRDALLLNDRGNALGLLQRWEEARAAYGASADASPRDFEAIPRSNEALVSFELGEEARAEREVRTLLRATRRSRTARRCSPRCSGARAPRSTARRWRSSATNLIGVSAIRPSTS